MNCHSSRYFRDRPTEVVDQGPTSPEAIALREPAPATEPAAYQERVETTAPIGMAVLKRKFTENIKFVLNYDEGKYKGKVFMTYLSNLNIDCEVVVKEEAALLELLTDYFHMPALVNLELLEDVAINVLLAASGRPYILPFDPASYIALNREIIDIWLKRMYSMHLFAIHCTGKYEEYVKSFPHDDNDSVVGLNYVSLIKNPSFIILMGGVEESQYTWNKTLFNEYIFAGGNLFSFFAVQENPLFAMVVAMQTPEHHQEYVYQLTKAQKAATTILQGSPHVPSV